MSTHRGRVQDKVVIITGANGGIGFAAAKLFNREGAKLVLVDLQFNQPVRDWVNTDDHETSVLLFEADITKETDVQAYSQAALNRYGKLDVVLLNAGLSYALQSWLQTDVDLVDKLNAVNIKGTWLGMKHGVATMQKSPHGGKGCALVITASVASLYGEAGLSVYTASKWALRGLNLTAAQEFGPMGIRCNLIQPGATATNMYIDSFSPATRAAIESKNTLNRAADPSEIANVMLFLASDEASFMNGSTVAAHAGQTPT